MTRRRFIADTWTTSTATLTGDQAAHLSRVLRAEPGQVYDVVANGFLHRASVTSVTPEAVHFTLHEELESDTALPLHLLIAVFKFDHLEWGIEKATELGIARITPILARRTEKHLAQSSAKRVDRWRRIALEASKQSRRTSIPEIADPTPLKQALLTSDRTPTRILLSEIEQSTPLVDALLSSVRRDLTSTEAPQTQVPHSSPSKAWGQDQSEQSTPTPEITHALAIGPEGGWTPEELQLFTDHAWQPVTLGPRILRAETAAIAAIAIAGAHLA